MSSSPHPPMTYGLHALKTVTVLWQVNIHAQAWFIATYRGPAVIHSAWVWKALLTFGALSMTLPMTAAAGLRLYPDLQPRGFRLPSFRWAPYLGSLLFLALAESVRDWLVYGAGSFFGWEVLHLMAVSLLIILIGGRLSIPLLWMIALALLGATPWVIQQVELWEHSLPAPALTKGPTLAAGFSIVVIVLGSILQVRLFRARHLARRYRWRISALVLVGMAAGVLASQRFQTNPWDSYTLKTLGAGALAGDRRGFHIWGIFPWAGAIVLGYLIYDLLVRFRASRACQGFLFAAGIFLLTVFYVYFADEASLHCTPRLNYSGFGGPCFNRTPSQVLLVVGIFLMLLPAALWAEQRGLENRWVRAISQSILWIYLFETSVLIWISWWWSAHVFKGEHMYGFPVVAVVLSCLLAFGLQRLPRLRLSLRKNGANP